METPQAIIGKIANAGPDISLSLQRILRGFMSRVGGAEAFGQLMADMILDEESSMAAKTAIGNNVMKLIGVYGDAADRSDLVTDDQVDTIKKLLEDDNADV